MNRFKELIEVEYEYVVATLFNLKGAMDTNIEECPVGFPTIYYTENNDTWEFEFDNDGYCIEIYYKGAK